MEQIDFIAGRMLIFLYYVWLWLGYCWWPVAVCNRVLSLPIQDHKLSLIRVIVHDLPMLAGPFVIAAVAWEEQSTTSPVTENMIRLFTWVCWLGWFGILWGFLRNQLQWRMSQRLSHEEVLSRFSRKESHAFPVVGWRPKAIVAKFPGNESRRCEFNRKRLDLFHLPAQLDGLRILHFSDVHFLGDIPREFFEAVFERISQTEYDLAIFSGDLIDDPSKAEWLKTTFSRVNAKYGRFAILGNHDWVFGDPEILRNQLRDIDWTVLKNESALLDLNGATIGLYGSEYPWMGHLPEQIPDLETADFRLLISHSPDTIAWARRQEFDLMLAGHNHGGQIRIPFYGPVYSPSRYGVRYASGVIDERPTLMHVSRGLSARVAIRYNCLPEVTEIVLRSQRDST
jgi:predicted MPP superfamily phosphohydrolase